MTEKLKLRTTHMIQLTVEFGYQPAALGDWETPAQSEDVELIAIEPSSPLIDDEELCEMLEAEALEWVRQARDASKEPTT